MNTEAKKKKKVSTWQLEHTVSSRDREGETKKKSVSDLRQKQKAEGRRRSGVRRGFSSISEKNQRGKT